jgi:tRNA(fMet)-specific endonuclease VapC
MMQYCLDTDTCIYAMKGRFPNLAKAFKRYEPTDFGIPAIVRAELLLGVLKSKDPDRTRSVVESFLLPFEVIPFGQAEAKHYAEIRHDLEAKGTPIGPNDLLIAATARARRLNLLTHNTSEFQRVPGLAVDDWCY